MGKRMTIQEEDDERLGRLKKQLGIETKVQVLRKALELLERDVARQARIKQWKEAVRAVGSTSEETNRAFQKHRRLKRK